MFNATQVNVPEADLKIVRQASELRAQVNHWRGQGQTVALVPTMGSLHEGHVSLVRLAQEKADKVCVSLFVNPRQFGPNEDFDVYPRDEDQDAACLRGVGTDLLYAPEAREIYPEGHTTSVLVGPLADILEGEHRPGFFTGVATVVTKLLLQCLPDVAIFGEKDYQQLQVIEKCVADLNIPVRILGGPTVREPDGLALSSRNAYLSDAERAAAPALHRTLQQIAQAYARGDDTVAAVAKGLQSLQLAGFSHIDYLTLCHAKTLQTAVRAGDPCRVLVAANLGRTRLIDNIAV